MGNSVLMALFFYPRGGSAQVLRYLVPSLRRHDVEAEILCGSLGAAGDLSHAATFFDGLPVHVVDYTPAVEAAGRGADPVAEPMPLHASYEDRPDVPDRVFTAVSPTLAAHIERAWERVFLRQGANAGLLHLHHLTPMHAAARAAFPDRPIVGHLHGTELRMLQRVQERQSLASTLGLTLEDDAGRIVQAGERQRHTLGDEELRLLDETRWDRLRYAGFWSERLRSYARQSDRLVAVAPHIAESAVKLLGVEPEQIVVIPNGVDTEQFDRQGTTLEERLKSWRRWLVEDPQGWDETSEPGSVRCRDRDLDVFVDSETGNARPVLVFVGRFVRMKRVPLLLRAYAQARARFDQPAPLVIWGGNPGEWEGEHPVTIARRERIPDVFFTGWRGHDDLPAGLNCADVMVAPSTNEPFGQVYLEAMACGLPVIGTRSGGPATFINTDQDAPNGWLVPPDDEAALADALVEAVNDSGERQRRAENAYRLVHAEYSWNSVAGRFAELYDAVIQGNSVRG